MHACHSRVCDYVLWGNHTHSVMLSEAKHLGLEGRFAVASSPRPPDRGNWLCSARTPRADWLCSAQSPSRAGPRPTPRRELALFRTFCSCGVGPGDLAGLRPALPAHARLALFGTIDAGEDFLAGPAGFDIFRPVPPEVSAILAHGCLWGPVPWFVPRPLPARTAPGRDAGRQSVAPCEPLRSGGFLRV